MASLVQMNDLRGLRGLLGSDSKRALPTCDDREGSGGVRLNWMGLLLVSGRWGERVVGVEPILYFCAVVSECVLGPGRIPRAGPWFLFPGGWMDADEPTGRHGAYDSAGAISR